MKKVLPLTARMQGINSFLDLTVQIGGGYAVMLRADSLKYHLFFLNVVYVIFPYSLTSQWKKYLH